MRAEPAQGSVTVCRMAMGDIPNPAEAAAAPIVGVFGATDRQGRWRPARRQSVLALFGGVRLDLREAELPSDALELRAYALFGGIQIAVPEGMRVELTGFSLFGGRSVKAGRATSASDTPVLHLKAVALFGGVAVDR